MDDIIYDASHTKPDTITQYCNCMHHNLELNATLENNDRVNFLDLSIIREASQLEIGFFRKPTTTDTTISYLYIHPSEQKLAAYRYYMERIFNLPHYNDRQRNEWQTIHYIAKNNKFPTTLLNKLKHQIQHTIMHATSPQTLEISQSGKFHIYLPTHTKIKNLFQNSNVKIAFRCNNTKARLTKPPNVHKKPPHNKWMITK